MSLLPEGECSAGKVKSPLEQGCFKSAQQCPEQTVHLLVKLDCEKAKLLTWGNTVAILHTRNEGRFSQLDEPESEKLIHRFTSLPYAQDTGGENPCIDTKDVLKLLIVGDSAVRLLITLERAPRGEKLPKRLPNGQGVARSQSSSSASRTVPELTT